MALISAQRVEFLAGSLFDHLKEFDETVYGISLLEFLKNSKKAKDARKTLGKIFRLLKLNPKLVIEDVLKDYLERRNLLVHSFWLKYLSNENEKEIKTAITFCNEFGQFSNQLERFFKGCIYLLALRHVPDSTHMNTELKAWELDYEYFREALKQRNLPAITEI